MFTNYGINFVSTNRQCIILHNSLSNPCIYMHLYTLLAIETIKEQNLLTTILYTSNEPRIASDIPVNVYVTDAYLTQYFAFPSV